MLTGFMPEEEQLNVFMKIDEPLIATIKVKPQISGNMIVSTKTVPFHETSNPSGGSTVYIAREVLDNGNE